MLSFPITGVKKKKKSSAKRKPMEYILWTGEPTTKPKKKRVKRAVPLTAGTRYAKSCSNAGRNLKKTGSGRAASILASCKTKGKK